MYIYGQRSGERGEEEDGRGGALVLQSEPVRSSKPGAAPELPLSSPHLLCFFHSEALSPLSPRKSFVFTFFPRALFLSLAFPQPPRLLLGLNRAFLTCSPIRSAFGFLYIHHNSSPRMCSASYFSFLSSFFPSFLFHLPTLTLFLSASSLPPSPSLSLPLFSFLFFPRVL